MGMDRQGIGTTALHSNVSLSVSQEHTEHIARGLRHTAPAPRERLAAQYLDNARGRGSSGEDTAFYLSTFQHWLHYVN